MTLPPPPPTLSKRRTMLTYQTEEEKKILAPLLGKIYVSPTSTEEKIRDLYNEVSIAIDDKLIPDATGRNALFKIHVSLGKIVNSLGDKQGRKSMAEARLTSPSEETLRPDEDALDEQAEVSAQLQVEEHVERGEEEEEGEENDDLTVVGENKTTLTFRTRDSLVEELLSDDEDEVL